MKLSVKIFILFLIFSLGISFAGAYLQYIGAKKTTLKHAQYHFGSIVEARARHLDQFLDDKKRMLRVISDPHRYTDLFSGGNKDGPLEEFSNILAIDDSIYEVFLLDDSGRVVITTNPEEESGEDFSSESIFENAKKDVYIQHFFHDEEFGKNGSSISVPIIAHENDKLLGVIVARFDMREIDEIMSDRVGLGDTGEIYLASKDAYSVTPLLFLDDTFLKQDVSSKNLERCVESIEKGHFANSGGHDEDLFTYRNFRGKEVLGVGVPVADQGWCVIGEVSEREMVSLLKVELIKSMVTVLVITLIVMSLFIFILDHLMRSMSCSEEDKDKKN